MFMNDNLNSSRYISLFWLLWTSLGGLEGNYFVINTIQIHVPVHYFELFVLGVYFIHKITTCLTSIGEKIYLFWDFYVIFLWKQHIAYPVNCKLCNPGLLVCIYNSTIEWKKNDFVDNSQYPIFLQLQNMTTFSYKFQNWDPQIASIHTSLIEVFYNI